MSATNSSAAVARSQAKRRRSALDLSLIHI